MMSFKNVQLNLSVPFKYYSILSCTSKFNLVVVFLFLKSFAYALDSTLKTSLSNTKYSNKVKISF